MVVEIKNTIIIDQPPHNPSSLKELAEYLPASQCVTVHMHPSVGNYLALNSSQQMDGY